MFEIWQTKNKKKSIMKQKIMVEWLKLRLLKYFRYFCCDKFIYLNTSTNEVILNTSTNEVILNKMFSSGFILRTIWTYIIWMNVLLGNELNDFYLDTLFFVKCFFNWGSSFFANWGTVFDLEIPTWVLLHTKLSQVATLFCKKLDF